MKRLTSLETVSLRRFHQFCLICYLRSSKQSKTFTLWTTMFYGVNKRMKFGRSRPWFACTRPVRRTWPRPTVTRTATRVAYPSVRLSVRTTNCRSKGLNTLFHFWGRVCEHCVRQEAKVLSQTNRRKSANFQKQWWVQIRCGEFLIVQIDRLNSDCWIFFQYIKSACLWSSHRCEGGNDFPRPFCVFQFKVYLGSSFLNI